MQACPLVEFTLFIHIWWLSPFGVVGVWGVSCMAGIASQSQRVEKKFTEIVIRRQQPRQARKRLLA